MAERTVRQIPNWARVYAVDLVRGRMRKAGLNPDDYTIALADVPGRASRLRVRFLRIDGATLAQSERDALRGAL